MATHIRTSICIGLVSVLCTIATPSGAQQSVVAINPARADAIHTCATSAARFLDYVWGNMEMHIYRTCMAGRGQRE